MKAADVKCSCLTETSLTWFHLILGLDINICSKKNNFLCLNTKNKAGEKEEEMLAQVYFLGSKNMFVDGFVLSSEWRSLRLALVCKVILFWCFFPFILKLLHLLNLNVLRHSWYKLSFIYRTCHKMSWKISEAAFLSPQCLFCCFNLFNLRPFTSFIWPVSLGSVLIKPKRSRPGVCVCFGCVQKG